METTREKQYEILDGLPPYGPMYIPVSQSGKPFYHEGFVIRFFKSDGSSWVANFEQGWSKYSNVLELKESNNLLVVSCGLCFLMNGDSQIPVDVFGINFSEAIETEKGELVFSSDTDLTIVTPSGSHRRTERISWDGLKDVSYENRVVSGLSFDPMYDSDKWVSFSYRIDDNELVGGSYNRYEIQQKRPWWKFWYKPGSYLK